MVKNVSNANATMANNHTNAEGSGNPKMKLINLNKKKDFLTKNYHNSKNFLYKPTTKMEVIKFNYNSKDTKKNTIEGVSNNAIETDLAAKKSDKFKGMSSSSTRKSIDIKQFLKSRVSETNIRKSSNEPKTNK
jgi:hypothetical protein